jgi:uncharacterized protein (DUF488 family)
MHDTTFGGATPIVLTIGHSTRTIGEFVRLLQAHSVTCVVDVRTIPRSRHNPQFNQNTLVKSLKDARIGYLSMSGLGGLRRPLPGSLNTGWRNDSFRGFADYMQTPEFESSLKELITVAKYERIALMCAEAVPWRCHRSLIADALLARGIAAEHIMSVTRRQVHSLTPFAQLRGTSIVYPAATSVGVKGKKSPALAAAKSIRPKKSVSRTKPVKR